MVLANLAVLVLCFQVDCAKDVEPAMLMHLLEKPKANRPLIVAIVECLEDPTGQKTKVSYLRCINDRLHIHQRTKLDSVGFVLGNYLVKSSTKFALSDEEDIIERAKVFGDCVPMLLRNMFGIKEYSFSCRKRSYIKGYDESDDDDFDEEESDIE